MLNLDGRAIFFKQFKAGTCKLHYSNDASCDTENFYGSCCDISTLCLIIVGKFRKVGVPMVMVWIARLCGAWMTEATLRCLHHSPFAPGMQLVDMRAHNYMCTGRRHCFGS